MKINIPLFLTALFFVHISCKKPKAPHATITVVDINEKIISGAKVNINSTGAVVGSTIDTVLTTDYKGNVYYTRKFECILEASVVFGTSTGKLTGTEYFQLKNNEETLKTIIIK